LPVVADSLPDHPEPLASLLAALDWTAAADPAIAQVVTAPGDAPFVPRDLVARLLHEARGSRDAIFACAASQGRTHAVIGLWPVAVRDELRRAVAEQGVRKIDLFTRRGGCATAEWPAAPVDPFFNVNTPEDLAEADHLVAVYPDL
jgi:molybdenum cofactor guanylyltransferase